VPVVWGAIQPTRRGGYDWHELDRTLAIPIDAGLRVLPFVYGTPRWLGKGTNFPIDNATARREWREFLEAVVDRYGPEGEYWALHGPGDDYMPTIEEPLPIREWQVWNEVNFFYFATPVSTSRYAKLLTISSQAIKHADPRAKVILSGLFGRPTATGSRGMNADRFLRALYRVPGLKRRFDGIALHPYAVDSETLEEIVEEFHDVTTENHDRVPLYITEMGWGSQNDFHQVAFEQGKAGQARQLRDAYTYLIQNRGRLDLKQVYWFSWKDVTGLCNYCDSVGLFYGGRGFRAKPAWRAFVHLSGGRPRP
jgi:hypothetical protein